MKETPFICSYFSRSYGESLEGTASLGKVWFLLEVDAPWAPNALEGSRLPRVEKEWLSSLLEFIPESRLLFIRQSLPRRQENLAFFIAHAKERLSVLHAFQLSTYSDLLQIDVPALLNGDSKYHQYLEHQPLFLICTHGRRDPCCAKYGTEVYAQLVQSSGLPAHLLWQSSHVGGHRFAANLLCFPHAVYYGRVEQEEARDLVSACFQGEMYLRKARGRAIYPPAVQAAEIYLRRQTGLVQLDGLELASFEQLAPFNWEISFRDLTGGRIYSLEIQMEESETETFTSCDSGKQAPLITYRLIHMKERERKE